MKFFTLFFTLTLLIFPLQSCQSMTMSPLERAYHMLQETPQGTPIEEVLVGMNKYFKHCDLVSDDVAKKYRNTKDGEYIISCRMHASFIGVPGGGRSFRVELDQNKKFIQLVEVIKKRKEKSFPWEEK